MKDPPLFELRIRLYKREHDPRIIVIRAWKLDKIGTHGRQGLTCEVLHGGKVIFPRGQLRGYAHGDLSIGYGKAFAMEMATMASEGDPYVTREQLAWVTQHGTALNLEREDRYESRPPSRLGRWIPRREPGTDVAHSIAVMRRQGFWSKRCDPTATYGEAKRLRGAARVTCMACLVAMSGDP